MTPTTRLIVIVLIFGTLAVLALRFPFELLLVFYGPALPLAWLVEHVLPSNFFSFLLGPAVVYLGAPVFWFAMIIAAVRLRKGRNGRVADRL